MTTFRESSEAVQAHLTIAQAVIGRMASNSASCKAWCIALVSAILVLIADKGRPQLSVIAGIPVVLFLALDAYYLSLERRFREAYNGFIDKLHHGKVVAADLYAVQPTGAPVKVFVEALASLSIWPFYGTLALMVLLTEWIIS